MLVTIKNLTYNHANKCIFDDVSMSVDEKSKIGVVGSNGSGKSTLLKIINGNFEFSTGNIFYKKNLTINFLEQNDNFSEDLSIEQIKNQYILKNDVKDYEINSFLTKFDLNDQSILISELSGGERKKLQLSLFFATSADLLLLDEPTNHLDINIISFIEKELIRRNSAIILVTHDRYFLERICNSIIEVDNTKLYTYEGNFEEYLRLKEERTLSENASVRKKNSVYRKELDWIKQGPKARGSKSKERINRFKELEESIGSPTELDVNLVSNYRRMGRSTISLKNVSVSFDNNKIIDNFNLEIERYSRIAIVGRNGIGKSSLLNLINGEINNYEGNIEIGETIVIGYYKQKFEGDLNLTVKEFLDEEATNFKYDNLVLSASQLLERFKFESAVFYQKLSDLSGGELKRLMLLKVLIKNPNVILLDEPTNDLDIEILSILEDYLDSFIGIVLFVSHDRFFIDRVSDYVLYFENSSTISKIQTSNFDYNIGKESKQKEKKQEKKKSEEIIRLTYNEKKELETIDDKLKVLEEELLHIDNELSVLTDYSKIEQLLLKREDVQNKFDLVSERWIYLYSKVYEIENSK